jgi:hypothetical protein
MKMDKARKEKNNDLGARRTYIASTSVAKDINEERMYNDK